MLQCWKEECRVIVVKEFINSSLHLALNITSNLERKEHVLFAFSVQSLLILLVSLLPVNLGLGILRLLVGVFLFGVISITTFSFLL